MEPRRIVTATQVNALVGYMEGRGDFVLGHDRSAEGRAQSRRAWDQCAAVVNRVGEPRSGREWAKYWCEIKCRVKAKLAAGAKPETFTPVEERIAAFVRRSCDTTDNVDNVVTSSDQSPAAAAEQPPRMTSAQPSESRGVAEVGMNTTQATQYSPSTARQPVMVPSMQRVHLEERDARLEERRARLEERRTRTDRLLAEAVLQRTEAAVVQAEAARTQAHALANISHALQRFVDLASHFMSQSTTL